MTTLLNNQMQKTGRGRGVASTSYQLRPASDLERLMHSQRCSYRCLQAAEVGASYS